MTEVVELRCAGGITLFTTRETLKRAPLSKLATEDGITETSDPKIVSLFLDTLRRSDKRLIVPEDFTNWKYLTNEARRLGLTWISDATSPSTICVACHAALSTGRLSPEVTFRKVLRIVKSIYVEQYSVVLSMKIVMETALILKTTDILRG
uniref:Transcriptional regulator n=1 Tax=Heterorhabditis bacteriophora TaxID=37862 RepID=A0A1I7XNY1_HETBA